MTDQTDLAAQLAQLTETVNALQARLDERDTQAQEPATTGRVTITGTLTAPFTIDASELFAPGLSADEVRHRIEQANHEQRVIAAQRYVSAADVTVDYEVN